MDFQRLQERILRDSNVSRHSCHGPKHWARVERNALYLSEHSEADPTLVRLFAMLHDCRRECDGYDPEHGLRAADYADTLRGSLVELEDDDFRELEFTGGVFVHYSVCLPRSILAAPTGPPS